LEPLADTSPTDFLTPALGVADPERPLEPAELARLLGPSNAASHRHGIGWRQALIGIGALAIIALIWQVPSIGEWLSTETLLELRSEFSRAPWTRAIAVLAFPLASLAVAPVTLLIVCCGVLFGPYYGLIISLVGTLLAAALNYAIGSLAGGERVRRMAGRRVNRVSRGLAQQGALAVAALRLVPIAPFTIFNIVAGASHISFRDYMLGTLLGMGPGIAVLSWLAGSSGSLLAGSDLRNLWIFLAGLGLLLGVVVALRAWIRRKGH
jgi:uncharacterized membrane protein YdjX (TVP38/TMEM64 family)